MSIHLLDKNGFLNANLMGIAHHFLKRFIKIDKIPLGFWVYVEDFFLYLPFC
jgi:hypothetical protein